jgi:hypothetical protein
MTTSARTDSDTGDTLMTQDGPDREDVRDLLDKFTATRRGGPPDGGGGGPPGGGSDDDDGLSDAQASKIAHIVGEARESNPDAMMQAEEQRRREEEAGIPAADADGNLSPGAKAVMDALTGKPPWTPPGYAAQVGPLSEMVETDADGGEQ